MAKNLVIWAQDKILPGGVGYQPLMGSGFTTLILASFHIHPDGSIYWNGNEMVDGFGNLQPATAYVKRIIQDLLQTGGFTNCLFSIGGGGLITTHQHNIYPDHSVSDEDFMAFYGGVFGNPYGPNTTNLSSAILTNFGKLIAFTGATGIDVDAESMFFTYPDLASGVALLSEWASNKGIRLTWTPYTAQLFWQSLWLSMQDQKSESDPTPVVALPLSWANIQPPAWDADQPPFGKDPARLASWARSFMLPVELMVAGFANDSGPISPTQIQNDLAACINKGVTISGAYLWTYDNLYGPPTWSLKEFATAMTNGLNGVTA